jgi:hypothetical protein
MSCCGDQRSVFRQEVGSAERNDPGFWTSRSREFEYSGDGELTVTGPLSGVIYHFSGTPGVCSSTALTCHHLYRYLA